ncbi:MAG: helix-turn-helix domain-containing protein [bacterium]
MDNLKELRESENLSLRDVENLSGVSNANISRWENHKKFIHEAAAEKLASIYDLPPLFLRNIQVLRASVSVYIEIYENIQSLSPEEGIQKLWKPENRLNKIWPPNSTISRPHEDLTEEIEFWRGHLLWIIGDAKTAIREGLHLIHISEQRLDDAFVFYKSFNDFSNAVSQSDLQNRWRALVQLVSLTLDHRFVPWTMTTMGTNVSFGITHPLLAEKEPIQDIIQSFHSWDTEAILANDLLDKMHTSAAEEAEAFKKANDLKIDWSDREEKLA